MYTKYDGSLHWRQRGSCPHRRRYGHPAEVIGEARRAAEWLHAAISAGAEPFRSAYRTWLDQAG